jgi:hypothetical protein
LKLLCGVAHAALGQRKLASTAPFEGVEMSQAPQLNLLPGAAGLGFGFNVVTADSPSDLRFQIVELDETHGTTVSEYGIDYLLPANVALMSHSTNSLKFHSFTSESQYSEYMSASTSASGSGWGFSAQFSASYSSLSEGDETNFYGLVQASSQLWRTQLKSVTGNSLVNDFVTALQKLPTLFDADSQMQYFAFFDAWGTHIVNQNTVGGSLEYLVTSDYSSQLSKQSAAASMEAEYNSLFVDVDVKAQADWNSMASSWIATRKAELTAVGGTPGVLAGLVGPSDPEWNPGNNMVTVVKDWTASLPTNPDITSIELTPIANVLINYGSTLAEQQRFQSLSKELNTALAVYLSSSIGVVNTSEFTQESGQNYPILTSTSTVIYVGENPVQPSIPPSSSDLSMYWIVMADAGGNVTFNQNRNSTNPDDFDILVEQAQNALKVAGGENWWVCICLINDMEAPLSTFSLNWLTQLGVNAAVLGDNQFYPSMACVVTMLGKTGPGYQHGQINHYQPTLFNFDYSAPSQGVTVSSLMPCFVNFDA